jgi:tRNA(Ile)-lysidine synthase
VEVEARVRATGLLECGRPVVVLLSGGRDSVCLLGLAVRLAGGDAVRALHLDYGLRDGAAADAGHCAALCARLGVDLAVRRPRRAAGQAGNLQAWARERRYAEAEALARPLDALVATGHTASDQAETVLYRLAASPGRRALLGMGAREGRVVRPLLGVTREETAAWCAAQGLPWREDPTNAGDAYARGRVRHGLLGALRAVHPAAEANVLRTLEVLRDEADVLDAAVERALAEARGPGAADVPAERALPAAGTAGAADAPAERALAAAGGAGAVDVARLAAQPPALARLVLQRLADEAAGGRAPAVGGRAAEVLALGRHGGSAALDLAGGLRAVVEYGRLRLERGAGSRHDAAQSGPVWLPVPGEARFADGVLRSVRAPGLPVPGAPERAATLDAAALATPLEVRPWRAGDRMRPLGLGGTRTLQDLFVDRKVPRARRRAVPVVLSAGEVAWVPGVAVGDRFRVRAGALDRVRLEWAQRP